MIRPALVVSVGLNGLLILAIAWHGWFFRSSQPERASAQQASADPAELARRTSNPTAGGSVRITSAEAATWMWSQLDRSSWYQYRDSLLAVGCPGRTVREIIEPLVEREYRAKGRVLIAPYVEQFWEQLRLPAEERIQSVVAAVEALQEEQNALVEKLFAGLPSVVDPAPMVAEAESLFSFLPPETRDRAVNVWEEAQEREWDFNRGFSGDAADRGEALKRLRASFDAELASFLSPEELAEYRLRRSPVAAAVRSLEGVNLTGDELKAIVEARMQAEASSSGAKPAEKMARERALLSQLLGPAKAADLARAENGEFQRLVRITDRLGLSTAQAAEFWEMRQQGALRAAEIVKTSSVPIAERRAQLELARQQIAQQAMATLGGERGRSTWERAERDWLDRVFSFPEDDPLAPPPP